MVTISTTKPVKIASSPKHPTGTNHFQFLCHQLIGFFGGKAWGNGGGFCITIWLPLLFI
jgi:hypothetical protein